MKVPDAVVKEIIRAHLVEGTSCAKLARAYCLVPRSVHQWVRGDNRGHLLMEVEKELQEKGK
ncbi:hypothetical protein PP740_gp091 [Stenotrophomonas phage Philippe]|uniref:Uncharacterized protein n=1 Tax=Stenotrophomonas phage Philippe TaxID=2859655 RepID=A0AAE7WMJ9_9CAUD|nr:hypothetical protein PP740_gp091 [Stenotrophomonas phage Philippe]QYW02251.1 hypothetical protein CPT_Philippe_058 [Stenotrophomonas phage Philippe]